MSTTLHELQIEERKINIRNINAKFAKNAKSAKRIK